jgi:hypothetical protein
VAAASAVDGTSGVPVPEAFIRTFSIDTLTLTGHKTTAAAAATANGAASTPARRPLLPNRSDADADHTLLRRQLAESALAMQRLDADVARNVRVWNKRRAEDEERITRKLEGVMYSPQHAAAVARSVRDPNLQRHFLRALPPAATRTAAEAEESQREEGVAHNAQDPPGSNTHSCSAKAAEYASRLEAMVRQTMHWLQLSGWPTSDACSQL